MNAIELIHASKYFNQIHALEDVSLEVQCCEVVAVLGPNGAGKTTAISLMLGLRRPTSGTVRLLGGNPQDAIHRRHVGLMLQDSGVPGMLRVRELIELYGRLSLTPLPLAQVLEMADLSEHANIMAANLSGGQRQRLYFALAVVGDLTCCSSTNRVSAWTWKPNIRSGRKSKPRDAVSDGCHNT
jgi:ABC-2 type transport system ATP-binding protein